MTTNITPIASDGLIALLKEQRDLYLSLRDLSDRQRGLIAGDRPELLLNILRDRQILVTKLAAVNEKLSPYRRNWQEVYDTLPEVTKHTASELLEEINSMLKVILKTDEEDQALLSARKQAVAKSLSGVSGGQAANTAYAKQGGRLPGRGSADITG